jgi:uncharacterized protein (TIGR03083 family)
MTEEAHRRLGDAIAAWAVDACPPEESPEVAEHVAACPTCSAEARRMRNVAEWLAAGTPAEPPRPLRAAVLSAARSRRAPGTPIGKTEALAGAYAVQIAAMDRLLASLTPAHWQTPVAGYASVRQVLSHLTDNDAMLASDLGLAPVTTASVPAQEHARRQGDEPHERWRSQAHAVTHRVSGDAGVLDRPVRLAGTRPATARARSALVQRTFETWIHADDIRTAMARPAQPPPPEHLKMIIEMGTAMLPGALRAAGREHPSRTARLVLTGAGGGEWVVPLAPADEPGHGDSGRAGPGGQDRGDPDITVTADAEEFCRLLANRRAPSNFPHRSEGDPLMVADLLHASATLGCD